MEEFQASFGLKYSTEFPPGAGAQMASLSAFWDLVYRMVYADRQYAQRHHHHRREGGREEKGAPLPSAELHHITIGRGNCNFSTISNSFRGADAAPLGRSGEEEIFAFPWINGTFSRDTDTAPTTRE